jgi:hypothetical protein
MEAFPRTIFPKRATNLDGTEEEPFSVSVVTVNCGDSPEDPLINLGYYNFDMECWYFHSDTLIDMEKVNFIWFYVPQEILKYAAEQPETL